MLDPALLAILCCPETRQDLAEAAPAQVAALNSAIAAGTVRNQGGEPVSVPLDGLLVRSDGLVGYPVRNDIPVLVVEEALFLA
jgi:uncharacterized protein YbaR (Trm112 family)